MPQNKRQWRTVFMGSPDFAVPALETLAKAKDFHIVGVVTTPPRPKGRSKKPVPSSVGAQAQQIGLPVFTPGSLKEPQERKFLEVCKPDVVVVAAFGQILPPQVLSLPTHGSINIHASLLPKYRGASPIQAAILEGDTETGITIMLMDEGLDTGPILATAKEQIRNDETVETLSDRLAHQGASILVSTLREWLSGNLTPQPQEGQPTMTHLLTKENGRIDWSRDAEYIARMVRAYTPWPSAWTTWNGKRVRIIHATATLSPPTEYQTQPMNTGIVLAPHQGDLLIQCGSKTVLKITNIQLGGEPPRTATEFTRGHPRIIGAQLG